MGLHRIDVVVGRSTVVRVTLCFASHCRRQKRVRVLRKLIPYDVLRGRQFAMMARPTPAHGHRRETLDGDRQGDEPQ